MINIFSTNSYHSGARYIHSCLSAVDQSRLDTRHVVIVPDRCSLEAERQMLATVGGSFNIVVLTFRRLAGKILDKYQYLTKQSAIVALTSIIEDVAPSLRCYTKATNTIGFASNMYDTIAQLKYSKISPSALLADNIPRSIADKMHDIGMIYSGYTSFMQGRYIDSADKLDILCDSIQDSSYCKDSCFYLYDFDNFTAQELAILSQLMQHSKGVSVACCASHKPQDKYLYINDIYNSVVQLCNKIGVTPNIIQDSYHTNAITEHIGNSLYRYGKTDSIDNNNFVSLFEGNTVVNEVYQLACMCARHVRSGGRYRDIFVITSDINNYTNAIHTIFGQMNIPYFCDQQFCVADHVYSQLIIDYLQMCSHHAQIGYVYSVVKNPLLSYGDKVYQFVNYTTAYNINYRLDAFRLGKDNVNYDGAESVRQSLYEIYSTIDMPTSASATQYVAKIRQLIDILQLPSKVQEFANIQSQQQLSQLAGVSMQVADKVSEVLTSISDVLGDRLVTLEQMIDYLANCVSAVNISVLPTHTDSVIFANMAKSRKHDIQILAVLGANHGLLPMTHKDTQLLTDYNLSVMQSCGIGTLTNIALENKRERFSLYQLLLEPHKALHISYSCSVAGDSVLPSSFVNNLREMLTVSGDSLPLQETDHGVYSHRQALSRVLSARQALEDNQVVNDQYYHQLSDIVGQEASTYRNKVDVQNLTIERGKQLLLANSNSSITKITSLYGCPYRFYHSYGLGLRRADKAQLDANIVGDILHAVLEIYLADNSGSASADKILDKVLQDDKYKAIFSHASTAHKLRRLRTEADKMCKIVSAQLRNSSFQCYATEMQFGMGGHIPPVSVPYSDGVLHIGGKIDRVDKWGDMFVVVDYKSGSQVGYNEHGLYTGQKLQLLVYLQAVMSAKELKPAGFYYFQLHNDFDKGSQYSYVGRTLADNAVIRALDNSYEGNSALLSVKTNKNGQFSAHSHILTEQQLHGQIDYACKMISQAGNLMSSGYIAMTPDKGQCKLCDFRQICDYGDIYNHAQRTVSVGKGEQYFGGGDND